MKAVLNVDGKQLEVTSISFYQGEITNVTTFDVEGEPRTYYDENASWTPKGTKRIALKKALKFPIIEKSIKTKFTELIEHLEEVIVDEDRMLTHLAISAMDEDLPFNESHLVEKQKEFKLMQQRVLGVIDTVEEVKAFMEGWYRDDDTSATNETEVANQTT